MPSDLPSDVLDVVVVGAGFAGLYALHRCRTNGLRVAGVEAGADVGGTWYWNRYPGARCDVESVDYSYSFDEQLQRDWVWTENYAAQPEIRAYLNHVADRFGLRALITFGQVVTSCVFDERTSTWRTATAGGTAWRSRFVILATGSLSTPNLPAIAGIDTFAGRTLLTAQWPEEGFDVSGLRVGVIGTGSSGIQSIPILARDASHLTVFQRSANFSVPVDIRHYTAQDQDRLQREYPHRRAVSWASGAGTPSTSDPRSPWELTAAQREAAFEERWRTGGVLFAKTFATQTIDERVNDLARDFVVAKIRSIVEDRGTAEDLIPTDHPIGSKRICTDSGYYETFNRCTVDLVNLRREPLVEVTPAGIRTSARDYDLDVIVYATGFDAMTGAVTRIDPRGRAGASLARTWRDGPLTYLGMAVPGQPNLFVLNGPGSPSVLANMVLTAEQQVDWVVALMLACRERGVAQVEPRHDVAQKWTAHVGEVAAGTLFPRANSWYMGANIAGKARVFMPYLGGFASYKGICDEVAGTGYDGFVLTSTWGRS